VIGAGPSGFYIADQLLERGFRVDLFDALPTPYGLVRAGVAPDHPKIKTVTRVYARIAAHPRLRFFGGVRLGDQITRVELLRRYHTVVYAVGAANDNRLGIRGEDRPGSVAATEFVGWYNGHPDHADRKFDLSVSRAVVIGNGNVALDVARMLVLDPAELERTDAADHALRALSKAQVREVVVLGRRGPRQASFTTPELRELGELACADVIVDPDDLMDVTPDPPPVASRNLEILHELAERGPTGRSRRIVLRFFRSPLELVGEGPAGRVNGVLVARNEIIDGRAAATDEHEFIECGLVVRSIGYRGRPMPGVPFDDRRAVIANHGGRVVDEHGQPAPGEYVVGWIKRGPSGVIGTNKRDAADTAARIIADKEEGRLNQPTDLSDPASWLRRTVPGLVTWEGWCAIDAHETSSGALRGRPRAKLVRVPEMLAIANRSRATNHRAER
jgi:ferredoxin--NADP+ reductase